MKTKYIIKKGSKIVAVFSLLSVLLMLCGCSSNEQKTTCNHNYYLSGYAETTTSGNGFKEFTCATCGNSYREVIPKKDAAETSSDHETENESPDLTRKRSVNLFDLPVYSDKGVLNGTVNLLAYEPEKTDVDGWKHSDCYMICGSKYEAWIRYDLNGKYSKIIGNIYDANSSGGSGWLEFYDGDDFLAATPKVDGSSTSVDFEIDISDVRYLTVRFCATDPGTWMIADDIMLTN